MEKQNWLDAQYSVLGSILISPEITPAALQATSETDFSGTCRTVYQTIRGLFLAGQPIDPVAVVGKLGKEYQDFVRQLMEITPTAANWELYAKICRDQARASRMQELARQMGDTEEIGKLQNLAEELTGQLSDRPGLKIVTMDDAQRDFFARQQQKAEYLSWPVQELNDILFCEPGDMIILGGYPSSGKSAWALQCAWHWAKTKKVGFFSLETSASKLFDRQISSVAGIGMDKLKRHQLTENDWAQVCGLSTEISRRKLEIIPAAGMSATDLRAVTAMRGYEIIFVDYLQLLTGSGENRTSQVTGISIALHTLAQSMGVTVVALSQLARPQDKKSSPAPDLNSLRESGQIEQDADVVMLLHRLEKDNPAGDRELRIRKNKEGTCPNIRLAFDGLHQTFSKAKSTGQLAKQANANRRARQRTPTPSLKEQMEQLPMGTEVPW